MLDYKTKICASLYKLYIYLEYYTYLSEQICANC